MNVTKMSQRNMQQQQNIELGRREEIPLNRMTSMEERTERRRMREIFDFVSIGLKVLYHLVLT